MKKCKKNLLIGMTMLFGLCVGCAKSSDNADNPKVDELFNSTENSYDNTQYNTTEANLNNNDTTINDNSTFEADDTESDVENTDNNLQIIYKKSEIVTNSSDLAFVRTFIGVENISDKCIILTDSKYSVYADNDDCLADNEVFDGMSKMLLYPGEICYYYALYKNIDDFDNKLINYKDQNLKCDINDFIISEITSMEELEDKYMFSSPEYGTYFAFNKDEIENAGDLGLYDVKNVRISDSNLSGTIIYGKDINYAVGITAIGFDGNGDPVCVYDDSINCDANSAEVDFTIEPKLLRQGDSVTSISDVWAVKD